jgi:hypothetical protein
MENENATEGAPEETQVAQSAAQENLDLIDAEEELRSVLDASKELRPKEIRFVKNLARSGSLTEAARTVNVCRETYRRWLLRPEVKKFLAEELVRVTRTLTLSKEWVLDKLAEVVESSDQDFAKLKALELISGLISEDVDSYINAVDTARKIDFKVIDGNDTN